ncbi:MAG: proteasome protein, partial [Halobacteriaceae archaeon]
MGLFGSLFGSRQVVGIAADTLSFAFEAAADTHPNEYFGLLRGESASEFGLQQNGTLITDVLVIPGTRSSPVDASV